MQLQSFSVHTCNLVLRMFWNTSGLRLQFHAKLLIFRRQSGKMVAEALGRSDYESEQVADTDAFSNLAISIPSVIIMHIQG